MRWLLVAWFALGVLSAAPADKITKETLGSGGRTRTFYQYVPDTVTDEHPAPLIVFLHGSGRSGQILLDHWKGLAKKEGIILAGPDSLNTQEWNFAVDPPEFVRDVVDIVSASHPVDPRRIYIFGHSAGAMHGLQLVLLESEYFAAAAVHAGLLPPGSSSYLDAASRKVPLAIWTGTDDRVVPLEAVRATRNLLQQRGFSLEFHEMRGHTHDYYSRSSDINKEAWAFLKQHALSKDPVFQHYEIRRP